MMAGNGLRTIASTRGVGETLDRLEAALRTKGITVFARFDHRAGAEAAGLQLRPTQVLVFGNPIAGTKLMQADQRIGIDLPLKALAWEDAAGKVWISWNEPEWLAARHALDPATQAVVAGMASGLAGLAEAAAA
jgi:uncharacterized protein (DUF302 family)